MKGNRLLAAYAILNAILYSSLLPLWEGFDEPFHFGYAQELANGKLPDARTSGLSEEVAQSILAAPASQAVKRNLSEVVTYSEYFSWPLPRRLLAQASLRAIPPESRWKPSHFQNYEAQQAPLAYALMAVPERLLASVALPSRVLLLRILVALAGAFLLCSGASALCALAGVRAPYRELALFCILSTQMTWATLAHCANDWLAVPLAIWTLVFMARCALTPSTRNALFAAAALTMGLLTKAYFLALLPVALGVCVLQRRWRLLALQAAVILALAGPWYAGNIVRYGTLTATQESRAGIGFSAVVKNAGAVNWLAVADAGAHSALWTGNNTFRAFSANTLNAVLLVCAVGIGAWFFHRQGGKLDLVFAAYFVAFLSALAFAAVSAYLDTHGAISNPGPWYAQVIVSPALVLCVLGAQRWRRFGRPLAALIALLFGYVLAATYVAKLIPLYAGYAGRTSLSNLAALYTRDFGALLSDLDSATPGSASVCIALTAAVIVVLLVQLATLFRALAPRPLPSPDARAPGE
jgi:hypothetical protein